MYILLNLKIRVDFLKKMGTIITMLALKQSEC